MILVPAIPRSPISNACRLRDPKIDKSLVTDMEVNENDAVIVRSTIDLAHNLGLKVTAEGVETQDIWDTLSILGCDQSQGYFMGSPMSVEKLDAWLGELAPPSRCEADASHGLKHLCLSRHGFSGTRQILP